MNDILQQLLSLGPGIGAGLSGNGPEMNAFMEGFLKTQQHLQQQKRTKDLDALALEDRTREIERQQTSDARAAEDQQWQNTQRSVGLAQALSGAGESSDTLQGAESAIDTLYRVLSPEMQTQMAPARDAALRGAVTSVTGRQKKQVEAFIDQALKTAFVADNPDSDPEIQLPEHLVKILGKQSARLSELQQFAQLPVGKPQGKTRVPAQAGSFEDYVQRKYGDTATPEQILEARKAYNQSDDRTPRVTVNTGANDNRVNSRIDRLVSSFNTSPIVKEFNEVQAQHQTISQIVNSQWSGPGDMSVVFAFMKALDPNSVVRETEYANAAKSGNIFSGWAARFNGALNPNGGFLSDAVKRDFLRTIEARMGVKRAQYDNLRKQTVQKIDRIKAGAPETGDEAVTDYGAAFPQQPTQNAPAAATPTQPGTAPAPRKANPFRPQ